MLTPEHLLPLERHLAYEHAATVIECNCLSTGRGVGSLWTDPATADELATPHIKDAVMYLEGRGLIERNPDHPAWVSIHDESEAA